jgi:glycosyltransferase involved in cell wall biosynthesis
MNIAIDASPLESGHKVRGVGFYITHLQRTFSKYFPENTYSFFKNSKEVSHNVEVVHYPYFDPFFITIPLMKEHKIVVTVHDLTPLVFPEQFPAGVKGNLRWHIQKFSLQHVDAIITDSQASKDDIVRIAQVDDKKVHVVYLAAGEEFIHKATTHQHIQLLKKYKLPEKFVLYVGDVTWNKNLPRLVKAIKEANLTLVMVGKSLVSKDYDKTNPWNQDLVEVQKETDNDKRFIKLGFVPDEDLVELYNNATVFAFPSLYEGFGLPVLEAMQSGCPVVTTREGSLVEVAGDAAYYVDAYDVTNIANGIGEVFATKQLRNSLIKKGFAQAKKYTWRKTAAQTLAVYKSIL